jgi:Ca-activated chloride channel family protein
MNAATRIARIIFSLGLLAATARADELAKLTITTEMLGDTDDGVVTRVTFRYAVPSDIPQGVPLVIVGSTTEGGEVVKRFRYPVTDVRATSMTAIQTLKPGQAEIEAHLMVPLEAEKPVIVAKGTVTATIAATNKPFTATITDGAEAVIAEGSVADTTDAVKIIPPHRDIAPNLFVVDVEVKPPVKRVEFWVEGKKIMARNAPPYRAELDLGKLPKRVEVKAIGYDDRGRYVDADAFVVNERENPVEVKITRTTTPDHVSHVKLSIQNPRGNELKKIELYGGKQKLYEWTHPPYAIDLPEAKLANVQFLRASVIDSTNYEASDLLFLNGATVNEELEVNLVELPVAVLDSTGAPILGMTENEFKVLENGKPQKITNFDAAANLPISAGILMDHSGSMQKRMDAVKKAAAEFLTRIIRPTDRAFVAGFSFDAKKDAPFVSSAGSLQAQVDAVPAASGGTSLYDAIVTALYRFRNLQGRKVLLIMTDGEDTTSRVSYDDMLGYARAARVPLYFIGIAMGISDIGGTSKMKALAAETGGVAYFVKDAEHLAETYAKLQQDLRSQYLIAYDTQSSKTDRAYRTVQVQVDKPGARVRTIRGFVP